MNGTLFLRTTSTGAGALSEALFSSSDVVGVCCTSSGWFVAFVFEFDRSDEVSSPESESDVSETSFTLIADILKKRKSDYHFGVLITFMYHSHC